MKIFNSDCAEVLKTLPKGGVDLVLCDPPYGTTDHEWDKNGGLDWDTIFPELQRVCKPDGMVVLFGNEPFSSRLRLNGYLQWRYDWIWRKNRPTGFANAKKRPLKEFENIMVFGSTRYFPQGVVEMEKPIKTANTCGEHVRLNGRRGDYVQTHTNFPRNILEYSRDKENFHPTQKPLALLEYLIKTYTQVGETILDFTMGAGNTGVAALRLGREFIGVELDKSYYDIAEKRLIDEEI